MYVLIPSIYLFFLVYSSVVDTKTLFRFQKHSKRYNSRFITLLWIGIQRRKKNACVKVESLFHRKIVYFYCFNFECNLNTEDVQLKYTALRERERESTQNIKICGKQLQMHGWRVTPSFFSYSFRARVRSSMAIFFFTHSDSVSFIC